LHLNDVQPAPAASEHATVDGVTGSLNASNAASLSPPEKSSPKHVMLSYNWSHQTVVLRLASVLKEVGRYSVWIE